MEFLYYIRDHLTGTHYIIYSIIMNILMFALIGYLFKQKYGKYDIKLATSQPQSERSKDEIVNLNIENNETNLINESQKETGLNNSSENQQVNNVLSADIVPEKIHKEDIDIVETNDTEQIVSNNSEIVNVSDKNTSIPDLNDNSTHIVDHDDLTKNKSTSNYILNDFFPTSNSNLSDIKPSILPSNPDVDIPKPMPNNQDNEIVLTPLNNSIDVIENIDSKDLNSNIPEIKV